MVGKLTRLSSILRVFPPNQQLSVSWVTFTGVVMLGYPLFYELKQSWNGVFRPLCLDHYPTVALRGGRSFVRLLEMPFCGCDLSTFFGHVMDSKNRHSKYELF